MLISEKIYYHFLLASYFTELVHISLIPDPESEAYFELLENALNHLPSKKDITAHKIEFELKLLHLLGVYPQLEHCVICSKTVFQEVPVKTELNPKKTAFTRLTFLMEEFVVKHVLAQIHNRFS